MWKLLKHRFEIVDSMSQVSQDHLLQENDQSMKVLKKIQAKAKLVSIGSFQSTELGRLKAHLLNSKLHG